MTEKLQLFKMIIIFKLNIMKKEKIKNRLLKLGILFLGILITFTNCEKEELIVNDIQLAKNWFEKERISELVNNPFNNKSVNWSNAILNDDGNIFVPIQLDREENKLALIIDNNLRKDIFYQPYYILTKIDNQNFTYVFKVFFDKNNSSIAEDFNHHLNLPYITYGNQNETLNSSVNFYNKNKELISAKDGCVVIDWFIVTSINGVIISEEYVGSTVDCNSEGLDDGSDGGGTSNSFFDNDVWDTQNPYDKWNKLTECEKDFFRSNPQHLLNARSNRAEAENAAYERFGNCKTPNDRPMLNTIGDAYRHAYFAALNTHNMGYTNAKSLGDAHECDTPSDKIDQKVMDLHNNAWGYHYGSTFTIIDETQFYNTFMIAYNSGQIKILQECE
jgi:hypothetical protein